MTMSAEQSEKVKDVIRLPSELPNDWKKSSLAEIAEIIMGQSPSSEYYNTEGNGLPFFQGKAEFGDLYPEAVKWCSVPGKIAQKDDVLISVRAPVGPTNLAPSECCIGRGLAAIRPRDGIPSKYVLHYLRSIESDIDSLGTGTTFKAISGKTLREIPVPIAPLDQQKRIVAEIEKQFSRLDEAVANLKRVKANLKRYKAAVLKAAIEGRLVETEAELARKKTPSPLAGEGTIQPPLPLGEGGGEGANYETGAQLLQRILETRRSQWKGKSKYKEPAAPDTTDLPELPEGWAWASVEQLSALVEYGSSAKTNKNSTGIPVLRMGNIVEGELVFDELKYLPTKHDEFPKLLLEPGDLLFNRTNSPELVGKTAMFAGYLKRCSFASYLIRVRLVAGYAPKLLAAYINSSHGRNWVKSVVTQQVGQANVNGTKLQALVVPLPSEPEQQRIIAEIDHRLSILHETEAQVNANLQRAERMRQSILSSVFTTGGIH